MAASLWGLAATAQAHTTGPGRATLDLASAERLSEVAEGLYVTVIAAQAHAVPGTLDHGCYSYLSLWSAVLATEVRGLLPLIELKAAAEPARRPQEVRRVMAKARVQSADLARLVGGQAERATDLCARAPEALRFASQLLEVSRSVEGLLVDGGADSDR